MDDNIHKERKFLLPAFAGTISAGMTRGDQYNPGRLGDVAQPYQQRRLREGSGGTTGQGAGVLDAPDEFTLWTSPVPRGYNWGD